MHEEGEGESYKIKGHWILFGIAAERKLTLFHNQCAYNNSYESVLLVTFRFDSDNSNTQVTLTLYYQHQIWIKIHKCVNYYYVKSHTFGFKPQGDMVHSCPEVWTKIVDIRHWMEECQF